MKKKYVIIGVCSLFLIFLGIIIKGMNDNGIEYVEAKDNYYNFNQDIKVQIIGEVYRPGVYEISSDSRLQDLIVLAGGFTPSANTNINLVQKLSDGMVIKIESKVIDEQVISNKISINKATVEELKRLNGIGDTLAKRIVEYRNNNGPFSSLNDLTKITGITERILNQIIDDITL